MNKYTPYALILFLNLFSTHLVIFTANKDALTAGLRPKHAAVVRAARAEREAAKAFRQMKIERKYPELYQGIKAIHAMQSEDSELLIPLDSTMLEHRAKAAYKHLLAMFQTACPHEEVSESCYKAGWYSARFDWSENLDYLKENLKTCHAERSPAKKDNG